jgi:hypothetical protein
MGADFGGKDEMDEGASRRASQESDEVAFALHAVETDMETSSMVALVLGDDVAARIISSVSWEDDEAAGANEVMLDSELEVDDRVLVSHCARQWMVAAGGWLYDRI